MRDFSCYAYRAHIMKPPILCRNPPPSPFIENLQVLDHMIIEVS